MEFSDFLTGYVCEGSFLFDGLIFGFGLQGDLLFKLNYTESGFLPEVFLLFCHIGFFLLYPVHLIWN